MPDRKGRPEGHCYIKVVSYSLVKGVVLMGNGRWAQVLRIVIWTIIVLSLMIATAPKAC